MTFVVLLENWITADCSVGEFKQFKSCWWGFPLVFKGKFMLCVLLLFVVI